MSTRAAVRYEDDFYGLVAGAADRPAPRRDLAYEPPGPDRLRERGRGDPEPGPLPVRELYSRYRVPPTPLLKWQFQPDQRSPSRRTTIRNQR